MDRGREGSDKQCGEDMYSAWRTNSYLTSFDTRAGQSRDDGCCICAQISPWQELSGARCHLECAIDWSCICSLSLPHTLKQLSFLNEILIGPDSKNAFFVYSYKGRVERIVDICVKKDSRTKHTS